MPKEVPRIWTHSGTQEIPRDSRNNLGGEVGRDQGAWVGEIWKWMKVWLVCFTEIGCAYNMYVVQCQVLDKKTWFQLPMNSVCYQDKCAKADNDRNSGNILMFQFLKLIFKIRVWKSSINFFRWVWSNSLYLPILAENWSPQMLSDFSKIELVAKSTAGRGQISKHSESFFPSISQYLIYNSLNGYLYSVFFIHGYVQKKRSEKSMASESDKPEVWISWQIILCLALRLVLIKQLDVLEEIVINVYSQPKIGHLSLYLLRLYVPVQEFCNRLSKY